MKTKKIVFLTLLAFAAAAAEPAPTNEMRTYLDARSKVMVRQLTSYKGDSHHLYFTNPGWYDQGRKLLFASHRDGRPNLYGIDLNTYEITRLTDLPPSETFELFATCVNPKKEEAYLWNGLQLLSVDLKSRATRTLYELEKGWRVHMTNCSADGKQVYFCAWKEPTTFKVDLNKGYVGFNETWMAKPPSRIVRVAVDGSGSEVEFEEQCWIAHLNTSPTRPELISFCHEGPWDKVDHRIWCMNVDTKKAWKVLTKEETGIIAGHEYWYADGETIGFHGHKGDQYIIGHIRFNNTTLVTTEFRQGDRHNHSNNANLVVGDGDGVIRLYRWNGTGYDGPRLLCEHKSSMKTQQSHAHPRFNADGSQVIFTSDIDGCCNVYLVDVPEFESLPLMR